MSYDSTEDTTKHIARVRELIEAARHNLSVRALLHDKSKLCSPEKEAFDSATEKLRGLTYGSPEYQKSLEELKPALEHHYRHNSHHPEHIKLFQCGVCKAVSRESQTWCPNNNDNPNPLRLCGKCCPAWPIYECSVDPIISLDGMSLLDVIEMLADWKAAGERHANGSMEHSLKVNEKRFNISPQMMNILTNTARELGWLK